MTYLLLDTSTGLCQLSLSINGVMNDEVWQADRELSQGLLGFINQKLESHAVSLSDVTGLAVYRGPGSFTGLRIGITVVNTLAEALNIPIVGEIGYSWRVNACRRLAAGESDGIVQPVYGAPAHITRPRK